MSATTWLIIAIVGFSLAGVALIVTTVMFFKMNVPAIIGDLSGKTIAREVKAMRATYAAQAKKSSVAPRQSSDSSEPAQDEKMSTEDIKAAHASKRLDHTTGGLAEKKKVEVPVETEDTSSKERTETLSKNATEVLSEDATDVLTDNATEVLTENATEILEENAVEGTCVLSEDTMVEEEIKEVSFRIVYDEVLIHTDEVIQ